MREIERVANHEPTVDGFYRLVGLANLTCGMCGCQVAPEMRERHRKVCVFQGVPVEPIEESAL